MWMMSKGSLDWKGERGEGRYWSWRMCIMKGDRFHCLGRSFHAALLRQREGVHGQWIVYVNPLHRKAGGYLDQEFQDVT